MTNEWNESKDEDVVQNFLDFVDLVRNSKPRPPTEFELQQKKRYIELYYLQENKQKLEKTMEKSTFVLTKQELFKFQSKEQWINKAKSWYATCGVKLEDTIAIDAQGLVARKGAQFMKAQYPITVYELED